MANDNGRYYEGGRDNSAYQRGHSRIQANLEGKRDVDSLSEPEFDDIVWRNADSAVGAYLVGRSLSGLYPDSVRAGGGGFVIEYIIRKDLGKGATDAVDSERPRQNPKLSSEAPEGNASPLLEVAISLANRQVGIPERNPPPGRLDGGGGNPSEANHR